MKNLQRTACLIAALLLITASATIALAETRSYYSVPDSASQQQLYFKPVHGEYYYVGDVKYTWSDNQNRWVCTLPESEGYTNGGSFYSGQPETAASRAPLSSFGQVDAYEYSVPAYDNQAYVETYQASSPAALTVNQSAYVSGSVYVPEGAALSNPSTACENLPSGYTFTINGVPITLTNAAYSKDGESQIYSPANGTQPPWYAAANGSGMTSYPEYNQIITGVSGSGSSCPTYEYQAYPADSQTIIPATPTYPAQNIIFQTSQTNQTNTQASIVYPDQNVIYGTNSIVSQTNVTNCPPVYIAGQYIDSTCQEVSAPAYNLSANGYFGSTLKTSASCVVNGKPCVLGICPNDGYCPNITSEPAPTYTNANNAAQYAPVQTSTAQQGATQTGGGILSQAAAATPAILAMEQTSLALLNNERMVNGLAPLRMDSSLETLARLKSQDMAANNYFAHESETYGNASDMLDAANISYRGVGENIAHYEDVSTANNALMSSAGHRQNILGSQWTAAGVGVALDDNGYPLITQIFAR